MELIDKIKLENTIKLALDEDIGLGDITTEISVDEQTMVTAKVIAKEPLVVCGTHAIKEVYRQIDSTLRINILSNDGSEINKNETIATIAGKAKNILIGERVALNFTQRLSGISTLTREFVRKVEGTGTIILDTRKTTPNLRFLEKYAVKIGGGVNHRFGLYDRFLFKDNHIASSATDFENDMKRIILKAKKYKPECKIEVEVDSLNQLIKILPYNPDIILLDNFSIEDTKQAVKIAKGKVFLEASGGINLNNVQEVAKTGVDGISIGALTHSAKAMDISMDFELC